MLRFIILLRVCFWGLVSERNMIDSFFSIIKSQVKTTNNVICFANLKSSGQEATTATSCGHEPNSHVNCTLVASNGAGNSSVKSAKIKTFCGSEFNLVQF